MRLGPTISQLDDLSTRWDSSGAWSTLMLGSAQTRTAGDFGILGRMGRNLGYEVQAEYFRVDQIWYSALESTPNDWLIEAFIEHENEIARAEETIRKLLQLGAGFKVLISYPMAKSPSKVLDEIARLVRTRHSTPADTRLLTVFGFLENRAVKWQAHEIDGMGRVATIP